MITTPLFSGLPLFNAVATSFPFLFLFFLFWVYVCVHVCVLYLTLFIMYLFPTYGCPTFLAPSGYFGQPVLYFIYFNYFQSLLKLLGTNKVVVVVVVVNGEKFLFVSCSNKFSKFYCGCARSRPKSANKNIEYEMS